MILDRASIDIDASSHVALTPEQLASVLRNRPDLLPDFERAYERISDGNSVFGPSLDAVREESRAGQQLSPALNNELIDGIVSDLVSQTVTWSTDGESSHATSVPACEMRARSNTAASLPEDVRPQVTGDAAVRHLPEGGSPILLTMYAHALAERNPRKARAFYDRFRQGLDILDLDDLMYDMISTNPASISHWLPQLAHACANTVLRIPKTTVAKVPAPLLQLTRIDYETLTETTHAILNRWAVEAFGLEPEGDYFIKTGIFSSKFDFRNARVVTPQEVAELGDYLLFVHQQSLSLSSPLNPVVQYGAGTTVEWVVREFINADPGTPTIYHGLPLRTEFRVFIDCDQNRVLSVAPYWEPNTMKHRFSQMEDAENPNNMHDFVTYMVAEPELMREFDQMSESVAAAVQEILPRLELSGQWSLDIMANGDDLWAIDMAPAHTSAFYETVPPELRTEPAPERWLPAGD